MALSDIAGLKMCVQGEILLFNLVSFYVVYITEFLLQLPCILNMNI